MARKLVKYTPVGQRWITVEQGHLMGRKLLIDDKGFIQGGNVPQAFQGHHIGKLQGIGTETNPYANFKTDELHAIHRDFWEAHNQDKQDFKSLVHTTAHTLKELHDQKFGDNFYITNRVKQHGGIKAPKPDQAFHSEYHESVPVDIRRKVGSSNGMAIDEMADELGMSADQLIQRLSDAENKGKLGVRDFYRDAEKTIDQMHGEGEVERRKESISQMRQHLRQIEDAIRDKMIEERAARSTKKHAAASYIDDAGRLLVKKNDEIDGSYYPSDRYAYKTNHKDPIYIPVNRINTPFQTEEATNPDKVRENLEKIKNGVPMAPIIIGYNNYALHDGHHRLEAAKQAGHTHVPCIVGGRNERRVTAAEKRYRRIWKHIGETNEMILSKKLAGHFSEMVASGDAHWVTVKEGPLQGRRLLIGGPRPAAGKQSKGAILAGRGIPGHVIERITGAKRAEDISHHSTTEDHILEHLERLDHFRNMTAEGQKKLEDRVSQNFISGAHRVAVGVKPSSHGTIPLGESHSEMTDQQVVEAFKRNKGWSRGVNYVVIHNPERKGVPNAQQAFVHGTSETRNKKDYEKRMKLSENLKNDLSSLGVVPIQQHTIFLALPSNGWSKRLME